MWDVTISSSLRLLLKVWIWYRCQKRIENYYHHDGEQLRIENYYHYDGEQLGFYENVHIKTQNKKKDVLVIFILHEMKISSKNTDESLDECRRV